MIPLFILNWTKCNVKEFKTYFFFLRVFFIGLPNDFKKIISSHIWKVATHEKGKEDYFWWLTKYYDNLNFK